MDVKKKPLLLQIVLDEPTYNEVSEVWERRVTLNDIDQDTLVVISKGYGADYRPGDLSHKLMAIEQLNLR